MKFLEIGIPKKSRKSGYGRVEEVSRELKLGRETWHERR